MSEHFIYFSLKIAKSFDPRFHCSCRSLFNTAGKIFKPDSEHEHVDMLTNIILAFANLLSFTYLKLIIVFSQSNGNALLYSIASNGVGYALLQEN